MFRARAFAVAVPASVVLGMLLLSAVVFLPQYFQVVRGMDASLSGLALTPLMLGVVVTMTFVGRRVSASGRYRAFPIAGAALTLAGGPGSPNSTPAPRSGSWPWRCSSSAPASAALSSFWSW
ncbi:hypothetical protein Atai01_68030 [Amycolatopsis taiwanensis]|uniref:Major facilitator superfamily (MFS) profile domain-containing protein n=1 Tax=Amycolatopsis taiwanensis TaxID=342230 RepID=A0A9W6R6W5_9PSEU|nr:hypothetical protein Atai01_68030 [Amycolatopsis taiwanensis]